MKLSEIARYWAARELTRIEKKGAAITLSAPFAAPRFTLHVAAQGDAVPKLTLGGHPQGLKEVSKPLDLKPNSWTCDKAGVFVCFDLPKGNSRLDV